MVAIPIPWMQQDGQKDIKEMKDVYWSAVSSERPIFYHRPPTWTSAHCAASVHIHSLPVAPGRAVPPPPIAPQILRSLAVPAPSSGFRRSDVYLKNPHGSAPNKTAPHVLAFTCTLKHLLCHSLSSLPCQGGSTMNDWCRELRAALSEVCSLLQSVHLWFALSFPSPSALLPSALLLGWGWWSGKADLSPRGEFALLMHRTQCCTSESCCMLHTKHGGRHLAASSKGCSLWIFPPTFIKSDTDILHWSKTIGLGN